MSTAPFVPEGAAALVLKSGAPWQARESGLNHNHS